MDELLAAISALFASFAKRGKARPSLGQILRNELAARVAPADRGVSSPARSVPPRSEIAKPVPAPPPPATTLSSSAAAMRSRPVEPAGPAAEVRLVTGLFASPQSLVAAFIVAEILAKPVALRDR